MSNTIILKKSSVGGKIPAVGDLQHGEIALNYADGKLYYKNTLNLVKELTGGGTSVGGTLSIYLRSGSTASITITGGELIVVGRNGSNISVPI